MLAGELTVGAVVSYCKTYKMKARCREAALKLLDLDDFYGVEKLSDLDIVEDTAKTIVIPFHGIFKSQKKVRTPPPITRLL